MSPFFVKQFKNEHKCHNCNKLTIRSLCSTHLEVARKRWIIWSHSRQEQGLCSYCHRRSFRGWVRCRLHTMYNRAVCKLWNERYAKSRYQARKALGVCVHSPEHGKVTKPHVYCNKCLERSKAQRNRT